MSMPLILPGSATRCQAISDIFESVALQQTALAHILNAEGEKIQTILGISESAGDMLAVNESVRGLVNAVTRLEILLQAKLELFKDCICVECIGDIPQ